MSPEYCVSYLSLSTALRVPIEAIAVKFIEYYWPQARPYRSLDSKAFVLRQNAGRQALVIKTVASLQEQTETLSSARRSPGWNRGDPTSRCEYRSNAALETPESGRRK